MKGNKILIWRDKKLRKKLSKPLILLCILLLVISVVGPVSGITEAEDQESPEMKEKTQEIVFEEKGGAGPWSFNPDYGPVYAWGELGYNIEMELPVEVKKNYNDVVRPDEEFSIEVDAEGKEGDIWHEYVGKAGVGVDLGWVEYEWDAADIDTNEPLIEDFKVPIGSNQSRMVTSEEVSLYTFYEEFDYVVGTEWVEVDFRAQAEVELHTDNLVKGNVAVEGDALEQEVHEEYSWDDETAPLSESIPVSKEAEDGDTFSASVDAIDFYQNNITAEIHDITIIIELDSSRSDPETFDSTIGAGVDINHASNEAVSGQEMSTAIKVHEEDSDGGVGDLPGFTTPLLLAASIIAVAIYHKKN